MKSKYPVLAGSILICELVVVYFAALAAFGLTVKTNGTLELSQLLIGASAIAVVGIVATILLPRRIGQKRPGVVLGWITQVLLLATGFILPPMFFIAAIFIALWVVALYWAARIDREVAERS